MRHLIQGCSLGLDVSVSRRSRDVVSKRLGLVSVSWKSGKVSVSISSRTENQMSRSRLGLVEKWEGLGLDLVSDWKSNVSVSSRSRTIGSRLQVNMHGFLLHCKTAPTSFFCEREPTFTFAICCRPSVRRLSVCNARAPYSGSWYFWQYFYGMLYIGHSLTFATNFTEIVPGKPSVGGVKHNRGSQI